uniref:Uncharacterized protein n=1 Tax=Serratia marcescens TaxID=615 RepID=A0A1C3HKS5_SERMA|nr:Uncharacterised protein [Serratia marcescens]
MAFIEDIVTPLRRLETALNEALLRLQQAQDTEALHAAFAACCVRCAAAPAQPGSIGPPPS